MDDLRSIRRAGWVAVSARMDVDTVPAERHCESYGRAARNDSVREDA